jgi:hypothetical protein
MEIISLTGTVLIEPMLPYIYLSTPSFTKFKELMTVMYPLEAGVRCSSSACFFESKCKDVVVEGGHAVLEITMGG